jgi:hypothetical protein
VAIGYTPVVNAAVLSVYRHVTDVAMLALVPVRTVDAVTIVGLAIISALAVKAVRCPQVAGKVLSREWCTALVWEVRRGVHWQNCEWAGGVNPFPPFFLVRMSEFPPPWDPIVYDVTRLRLNQLFVGLAIFVSVC